MHVLIPLFIGYLIAGAYLAYRIIFSGNFRIVKSRWSLKVTFVIITLAWLPVILANLKEDKATNQPRNLEEALNRPVSDIVTPESNTWIRMPGLKSDGNVFGDDILGVYDEYLDERKECPRNLDEVRP